jgi:DNA-binding GntR family transcriptional regulator
MPKRNKKDVYADIRQKIITLEFGPGSDLDEGMLVQMYGVSRTPIRETLIRLAGEGLVTIKRNRGAYVSPLDISTLQAYFEAAEFLTRAMVRLAASRRTASDLRSIATAMTRFESALEESDMASMVRWNDRFHDAIGRAAHNDYLYAAYRRVLADHERIAQLCFEDELDRHDTEVKSSTLDQHSSLVAALERGDADMAERVSVEHIGLCKRGLQQLLARPGGLLGDIRVGSDAA